MASTTGQHERHDDAFGYSALNQNTTGEYNVAFGYQALYSNNGSDNTAVGSGALYSNTTGNGLTCIGFECNAPGNINNATGIGAHAVVEQSNSLVLGGSGDYAVNVGIGTTKPSNILTIGSGATDPTRFTVPRSREMNSAIARFHARKTYLNRQGACPMQFARSLVLCYAVILLVCAAASAQQASTSSPTAIVPRLVNFSGKAVDSQGEPIPGVASVTFAIYQQQYEGAPLWMETQNVTSDANGKYSVQLGAASAQGLPLDLFTSGEARWLGVRFNGGEEQPRVLLLSVPYALKAADAETVGGLPASAFVLAAPAVAAAAQSTPSAAVPAPSSTLPPSSSDVTTSGGTANALPLFTSGTNVQNSIVRQTGTTAVNVGGKLNLPATGVATASKGFNSRPLDFAASSFNKTSAVPGTQTFQWQAEPANNNTTNPSATLNLLYGFGTSAPAETGLRIGPKGIIGFAAGQTFPGTGTGTITGVTAGTNLSGGGTSGNVTLSLNTANVPQLNSANAFNRLNTFPSVGIGTSFPLANLDVMGGGGLNILLGDPGCGTFAAIGFQNQALSGCANYALLGDASGGTYLNASGSSPTIHFRVNNNDEVMDIESNTVLVSGQVGIGTLSPGAVLDAETAGTGIAGYFQSDSDNGNNPTLLAINRAPSADGAATAFAAGGNWNFEAPTACWMDQNGNLGCSGSKSAVVPVDGGSRRVALYAVEAPENWFEDYGSGQLLNGSARIDLEPTFAQTVNTDLDYHVFLTPNSDCKGLYVSQKSPTSFEVHELGGGTSSVAFDYRIIAKRKNYENIRLADNTERYRKLNKQIAGMRQRRKAAVPAASNPASALGQKPATSSTIKN